LPFIDDELNLASLEKDFENLIGPDNIVIRTSVKSGQEKIPNLKRTEGVTPSEAASWCIRTRDEIAKEYSDISGFAFVVHRFIAARAAAWVRCELNQPVVEIHSLWGLPDALQYCPYDIWEVHLPTEVATELSDYKSHMLIPQSGGDWEYVRIKNELGRNLSIGRREAIDLARRSSSIAERLGKSCHIMWFVGCMAPDGRNFNLPWYWTDAHPSERNHDRSNYQKFKIQSEDDLLKFLEIGEQKNKYALELMPNDQKLMRDIDFIKKVGEVSKDQDVPVLLAGSTLAHAYFVLRKQGCTVVASGEKEYTRVRNNNLFGKIVRDGIPAKIANRQESGVTLNIPSEIKKRFLSSKLLEEALEVRYATSKEEKCIELSDLYEVFRGLAKAEGISLNKILKSANDKRKKSGGFDDGVVLLQTGILGGKRAVSDEGYKKFAEILARKVSNSIVEIPFTFFGFMDIDNPRSVYFEDAGIRLDITLKSDRIELQVSKEAEQLELPLDQDILKLDEN
jgi:predicted house-cleaning noncanonical NTP pyrophosphatase (MazG superfamily)